MNESDSNEALLLFSALRTDHKVFLLYYDELGSALTNSPAISLSVFSLSLHISTSRVCAVEEANRYRMCAQEPCLHFLACSLRQCLFFDYVTRKRVIQKEIHVMLLLSESPVLSLMRFSGCAAILFDNGLSAADRMLFPAHPRQRYFNT